MATKLTKKDKQVLELFLRYEGKAPSIEEVQDLIAKNNGSIKKITTEIKTVANTNKTPEDKINDTFMNLFGRPAKQKEIDKYLKAATKDKLNISSIIKSVPKEDKAVYKNKAEATIVSKTLGIDIDVTKITSTNKVDTKAIADTYVENLIKATLGDNPTQKQIDKLSKVILNGKTVEPKNIIKVATKAQKAYIKAQGGIDEVVKTIDVTKIIEQTQEKANNEVATTPTEPTPTEPTPTEPTPTEPTPTEPTPTFTVTNTSGIIKFNGTPNSLISLANGDNGDLETIFTKGDISIVVDNSFNEINLTSSQEFTGSANVLNGKTITGEGSVVINKSNGDQSISVESNGINTIAMGLGADTINLGKVIEGEVPTYTGVDTIIVFENKTDNAVNVATKLVTLALEGVEGDNTTAQIVTKSKTLLNSVTETSDLYTFNSEGLIVLNEDGVLSTEAVAYNEFITSVKVYETAVLESQSDSNIDSMDTINNFDINNDILILGFGNKLLSNDTTGITVTDGIVTSFGDGFTGDLNAKFNTIFDAMGTIKGTVAFTDGTDTYVLQNDGDTGLGSSDIIVKLAGINDLTNVNLVDFIA